MWKIENLSNNNQNNKLNLRIKSKWLPNSENESHAENYMILVHSRNTFHLFSSISWCFREFYSYLRENWCYKTKMIYIIDLVSSEIIKSFNSIACVMICCTFLVNATISQHSQKLISLHKIVSFSKLLFHKMKFTKLVGT